ncbi:hypothetical protein Q5P01_000988 [Channa striata]|uniref:Uncharacterized protein n=1 Tax=Channa striata TaxID=64152 RepID=A0AA88IYD7_CHASR|nr:hypothetical protein Q5P01_000988 [Channa striata]
MAVAGGFAREHCPKAATVKSSRWALYTKCGLGGEPWRDGDGRVLSASSPCSWTETRDRAPGGTGHPERWTTCEGEPCSTGTSRTGTYWCAGKRQEAYVSEFQDQRFRHACNFSTPDHPGAADQQGTRGAVVPGGGHGTDVFSWYCVMWELYSGTPLVGYRRRIASEASAGRPREKPLGTGGVYTPAGEGQRLGRVHEGIHAEGCGAGTATRGPPSPPYWRSFQSQRGGSAPVRIENSSALGPLCITLFPQERYSPSELLSLPSRHELGDRAGLGILGQTPWSEQLRSASWAICEEEGEKTQHLCAEDSETSFARVGESDAVPRWPAIAVRTSGAQRNRLRSRSRNLVSSSRVGCGGAGEIDRGDGDPGQRRKAKRLCSWRASSSCRMSMAKCTGHICGPQSGPVQVFGGGGVVVFSAALLLKDYARLGVGAVSTPSLEREVCRPGPSTARGAALQVLARARWTEKLADLPRGRGDRAVGYLSRHFRKGTS